MLYLCPVERRVSVKGCMCNDRGISPHDFIETLRLGAWYNGNIFGENKRFSVLSTSKIRSVLHWHKRYLSNQLNNFYLVEFWPFLYCIDESNIKWQWQKCQVRRYAVSIILANISIECNFVVIRLIELSGSYKITTRKALFLEKILEW